MLLLSIAIEHFNHLEEINFSMRIASHTMTLSKVKKINNLGSIEDLKYKRFYLLSSYPASPLRTYTTIVSIAAHLCQH